MLRLRAAQVQDGALHFPCHAWIVCSKPPRVEGAIFPAPGDDGLDLLLRGRKHRKEHAATIARWLVAEHLDELVVPGWDAELGCRKHADGARLAPGDIQAQLMKCNKGHSLLRALARAGES